MILSLIILLSCSFTSVVGDAFKRCSTPVSSQPNIVSTDGGHISNGQFVIPAGELLIRITKEKGAWLTVGDNTELVINGNILLESNGLSSCDIIKVTGRNVRIHGQGSITGDRLTHKGKNGEWGMGIRLHGAGDVTVNGLTIINCWGDCIYIGGGSKNVKIDSCVLQDSRRQGISITNANDVAISDCRIANISGTKPGYAIDIEPNKQCVVDNVLIRGVSVVNCEGGLRAILGKKTYGNARIGKVEIRNCHVMAKSRHTVHFAGCDQTIVTGCTIETRKGEKPILTRLVGKLTEKNNKVVYK